MATIFRAGNTVVRVYANDHAPPHFHVTSPEREAQILIGDLTILRGELTSAEKANVWTWIEANIDQIVAEWNRINPKSPVGGGR